MIFARPLAGLEELNLYTCGMGALPEEVGHLVARRERKAGAGSRGAVPGLAQRRS